MVFYLKKGKHTTQIKQCLLFMDKNIFIINNQMFEKCFAKFRAGEHSLDDTHD